MVSNISCKWSKNIQAATLNIEGVPPLNNSSPGCGCNDAWKRATEKILDIDDSSEYFKDPLFFTHFQRVLATAIYTKHGSGVSQTPRVLKIPIKDETFQNMGRCAVRVVDGQRELDMLFNLGP